MKKSFAGILVAVVAIGAIVGVVLANRPGSQESASTQTSEQPAQQNGHNNQTAQQTSPDQSNNTQQDETASTNQVDIANFAFSPKTITVKKGTTVTWTNKDSVEHNVHSDTKDSDSPNGPLLGQGESYSHTFTAVGTYNYYCQPHPSMKGTVIVTD